MASAERPLSPHLQVYRPQWTSILSISHRATGIVLSVGAVVLVWWLVAAADSPAYYQDVAGLLGSVIGQLFLFGWTFCLMYHLMNGIRHLVWDAGGWLELEQARKSGTHCVVAAVVLTVVSWIAAYAVL
ncbi:MAG: succinate dehydrogenase, cytochrome b556 subunit [Alphaproteobacteria bacterium]|nr:succinate dehydrogenase, cytochrome b556 subunit [Alphaproteobacteria bacterium]MCB9928454.1 succinate dehydrogenase, cytochrome b556 subunit [Alphaproteobacteria bacterium]